MRARGVVAAELYRRAISPKLVDEVLADTVDNLALAILLQAAGAACDRVRRDEANLIDTQGVRTGQLIDLP